MLLALDSATRMLAVALHDGGRVLAESTWEGSGHHTVQMAPEVAILLRRVGVDPGALTAVAVTIGPGSYNGLRVGLALAKGIALAHGLMMVGIPTLDVLAAVQPKRDQPMLAILQAGRGRLAGVWYKWARGAWKSQGEAESLTWEQVPERLSQTTYLCGEIDPARRDSLAEERRLVLAPPSLCVRRPAVLAELALSRLRSKKPDDPASLAPIYLQG